MILNSVCQSFLANRPHHTAIAVELFSGYRLILLVMTDERYCLQFKLALLVELGFQFLIPLDVRNLCLVLPS